MPISDLCQLSNRGRDATAAAPKADPSIRHCGWPEKVGVSAFHPPVPERRWSSRRFPYGYLVTTSPQSLTLPWPACAVFG